MEKNKDLIISFRKEGKFTYKYGSEEYDAEAFAANYPWLCDDTLLRKELSAIIDELIEYLKEKYESHGHTLFRMYEVSLETSIQFPIRSAWAICHRDSGILANNMMELLEQAKKVRVISSYYHKEDVAVNEVYAIVPDREIELKKGFVMVAFEDGTVDVLIGDIGYDDEFEVAFLVQNNTVSQFSDEDRISMRGPSPWAIVCWATLDMFQSFEELVNYLMQEPLAELQESESDLYERYHDAVLEESLLAIQQLKPFFTRKSTESQSEDTLSHRLDRVSFCG